MVTYGDNVLLAKVVLLFKQLDLSDAETYVIPCGLWVAQLPHLQNPQLPTQSWWQADRLPRWIRNLGKVSVVQQIRSDLRQWVWKAIQLQLMTQPMTGSLLVPGNAGPD